METGARASGGGERGKRRRVSSQDAVGRDAKAVKETLGVAGMEGREKGLGEVGAGNEVGEDGGQEGVSASGGAADSSCSEGVVGSSDVLRRRMGSSSGSAGGEEGSEEGVGAGGKEGRSLEWSDRVGLKLDWGGGGGSGGGRELANTKEMGQAEAAAAAAAAAAEEEEAEEPSWVERMDRCVCA